MTVRFVSIKLTGVVQYEAPRKSRGFCFFPPMSGPLRARGMIGHGRSFRNARKQKLCRLKFNVPPFTKKRLLRNSAFLLQVVFRAKAKHNILRFGLRDFEFRNSLKKRKGGPATRRHGLVEEEFHAFEISALRSRSAAYARRASMSSSVR
jgi:hypothetical protein